MSNRIITPSLVTGQLSDIYRGIVDVPGRKRGPGGPTQYAAAVLADSPFIYWKAQEASGNLQDSSGNGRHVDSNTISSYQNAGPMGDYAVRFQNSYAYRSTTNLGVSDNWSMELWTKISAAVDQYVMFAGNSFGNGFGIYYQASPAAYYGLNISVAFTSGSSSAISANTWNHLVIVRESTVWKCYLNGAVDNANMGTISCGGPDSYMMIGGQQGSSDAYGAHFAFYAAPLSAAQVLAHYNASQIS